MDFSINGKGIIRNNTPEDLLQKYIPEISRLHDIYDKFNIYQKQTIVRGVFKDRLLWDDNSFRTAFINPTFKDNMLNINEKGLLFYEQPFRKPGVTPVSTRRRNRTGTVSYRCLRPTRLPVPPAGHIFKETRFFSGLQTY